MSVDPNQPVTPPAPEVTPPAGPQPALFTKYGGDWQKANEGYFNAVQELGRVHEMATSYAQEAQRLQGALRELSGGQPAATDPLSQLQSELGLPPEPFQRAIDSRVDSLLETKLQKMFEPVIKQIEADEKLAAQIDNFHELKTKAQKYLKGNSEVEQTFNAVRQMSPENAWKYAIREMLIAEQAGQPQAPTHAALPGVRSVEGRGQATGGPNQATREKEALEYARQYGDDRPYVHERMKGTSIERAIRSIAQRQGLTLPEGW